MIVLLYIFAIIGLVLLVAFLLPNKYSISKTIIVNAAIKDCYMKIADLNNYKQWNPFAQMEPDASSFISGEANTVGHQYTWDGKKIGTGGLTILTVTPYTSIELELAFLKPFNSKAKDAWSFEQLPNNQVKITWANTGELKFPVARLMGPMIHKNLSQQFEKGLENIKTLCEKNN